MPGLMDTYVRLPKRLLQLQESISICPQPHAFLLIFSSAIRMTKDEVYTVDVLRVAFGENVFDHCIVVFTRGSLFQTDQKFKAFWEQSEVLVDIVKRCGGRIIRIENESLRDLEDNEDVNKITEMMEKMSNGGKKTYTYDFINTHRNVIKEHLENYKGPEDYQKELSAQINTIGTKLNTKIWNVTLLGRTIAAGAVGVLGVAAAGYGIYVAGHAPVELAQSPKVRTTVENGISAAVSLASKAKFW